MSISRIFVGTTGASGAVYGITLVRTLVRAGIGVAYTLSPSGAKVLRYELDLEVDHRSPDLEALFPGHDGAVTFFPIDMVEAPVSSGTHATDAAVICPCSMGTLGSIAAGTSANLIERAADVMLKEGRPLVLVPRETPLSLVHLRNMTRAAEAGAAILPAAPGFYHRPETIGDLVDHVVTKITDRLGIRLDLIERWDGG
ncbi:MAG: UbiX family flavin prenyltransferase [Planctomycetota bacterium]|jgi:4-hydroxy-3-polyprenylbenzoate decarboxylase